MTSDKLPDTLKRLRLFGLLARIDEVATSLGSRRSSRSSSRRRRAEAWRTASISPASASSSQ